MNRIAVASRSVCLACLCLLACMPVAEAAEIHVMISGGFSAAYAELVPAFERETGNTVVTARGPSMGETRDAIPQRLARGEPADLLIMVEVALDGLIANGKVVGGSRVDLARSGISMAVRAGAARPDIGTLDALKRTLTAARSIAYSDSASGVYLETVLFPRLDADGSIKAKSRMIPAEPVGAVVARGEAELGFQQQSELMPIPGIDLVGPLPPGAQKFTVFAAGISATAREPEAARAFVRFLASPAAAPAIVRSGMEPVGSEKP